MKVYVGSKFSRAKDVQVVQNVLISHGHDIVGDWTKHTFVGMKGPSLQRQMQRYALDDFHGVEDSDAFVMLHDPASRGGFTELGIALGQGKLVAVLDGRNEAPHQAPIFYTLPQVYHFEDATALAEWFTFLDTIFAQKSYEGMLEVSK